MRKSSIAIGLAAAAATVLLAGAAPAAAAPATSGVQTSAAQLREPGYPCGYHTFVGTTGNMVKYYNNCSGFGAGIRIVYADGSLGYACVGPYQMIYLNWNSRNAYTFRTC
ncbi:hypothetical protein [Virgisporangium aurantiacum]|uniref:Uncharacterized protein n=1 Tax=Virgisporangium aurantiacum TaxID=175570 RepID=A0A8J3ZJ08_9ACTN|nr:hypothetical protein [Virgisporangium aurantiacum]GIJ63832.1 hypothetical protein Vau01_113480 [Virgisporangium aurantiacum]